MQSVSPSGKLHAVRCRNPNFIARSAILNGRSIRGREATQLGMKPSIFFLGLFAATALSACSGEESSAQKVVLPHLLYRDSAKFGTFTRFDEDLACLGVNSANAMGNYTGEHQAMLIKKAGGWNVLYILKAPIQK
jgi:hypothetical protein